jgi:transposase
MPTKDIFFGEELDWMYQQDNAPSHKAKSVTAWFKQNNINVFQWPARCPDLNPIENVWTVLDRKLTKEPVTSAEDLRENLKQSFEDLTVL